MTELPRRAEQIEAEPLLGPRRLGQQLAMLLAAEIVSGGFEPGEAFPSAEEIVTRYGVSRTVARETVQTLALLGLVHVQHGKRTEVLPPDDWDILSGIVQEALRRVGRARAFLRDVYEFRLLIEPRAAALMAERATGEQLQQLAELASTMETLAGEASRTDRFMAADREFHHVVSRASGNRVLAAVSRDIREILRTLWELSRPDPEALASIARQHRAIADAIGARDPAAAGQAMHDHLLWASQADLAGLVEEEPPAGP